jgi:hypothetical protein
MGFCVEGVYDSEKNIAWMTHSGFPEKFEELDAAFQKHVDLCGSLPHRVYVVSDVRNLTKLDYRRVSYHYQRIRKLRKERAALTVIIVGGTASRFSAKLYEFISGLKIATVGSREEALKAIEKAQQTMGIRPPL